MVHSVAGKNLDKYRGVTACQRSGHTFISLQALGVGPVSTAVPNAFV